MQDAGGEAPTWIEPKAGLERQTGVLEKPTRGEPDTTHGEAMEVPALDKPPVVEATGGVIETEMVEEPECPEGTTPGNVDEGAKATPAPMPVLLPHLEATNEFQDMPELEDAEPEDAPREEPLVDVPPAKAMMNLRGLLRWKMVGQRTERGLWQMSP